MLVSKILLMVLKGASAMMDIIETAYNANRVYQVVINAQMVLHALNAKLHQVL